MFPSIAVPRFAIACLLPWLLVTRPVALPAQGPSRATTTFTPIDSPSTNRGALRTPVTMALRQVPLLRAIDELTMQARLSYVVDRALPTIERRVDVQARATPVRDVLSELLRDQPVELLVGPAEQLVLRARPSRGASPTSRQLLRVSGFVRNVSSGEVIRRAQLVVNGTTPREANEEGFYVLLLPRGTHRLQVRALGFAPLDTTIELVESQTLTLQLRTRTVVLSAMNVQASQNAERSDLDPNLPDMSTTRLDLGIVRKAPPLLGEVDPLRSLTLLPGVSSSSDASSAFNVRGGSVDQNLILLDEATLYNPSHVLGFLSTFNADAVDDVMLYKGAIPAKYGGRLSSVVDVRQREGNAREFAGAVSIGLLASRGIVEGPLPRGLGSVMVAARRSYADAFLGLSSDSTVRDNVAYFYDLNAKANIRLGRSGALMFSTYAGRDRFAQPEEQVGVGWGNRSTTVRWNQAIGRLFSKLTATTSTYDHRFDFRLEPTDSARWSASIRNANVKLDETFRLTDRQTLEFGGEVIDHAFRPGAISPRGDTTLLRARTIDTRYGVSTSAYLGHEVDFGRVGARYGVRYGAFTRNGPFTRHRYENDAPVVYNAQRDRYEAGRLLDSTRIAKGERLAHYDGWEPRASMRFSLSDRASIKMSYARTQQFLQLVSNTNSPTPLDVWEPVGEWIRPQRADQVAIGYSARVGTFEFTAEAYGKRARNVVDYIDGADVVFNPRLETLVVQGEGRAYGLELFLRRTAGRLTGWGSYTLARAEQRFPVPPRAGAVSGGGVNGGRWYASPFDKTHNLSLVGVWQWTPKWTLSPTFLFATGLPITLPESRYVLDGFLVAEYGARNATRLPAYHRLDVNLARTMGRGELQFGALNVYNRFNAQSLRVRQRANDPLGTEAVQTSIFGVVPSINYLIRF